MLRNMVNQCGCGYNFLLIDGNEGRNGTAVDENNDDGDDDDDVAVLSHLRARSSNSASLLSSSQRLWMG